VWTVEQFETRRWASRLYIATTRKPRGRQRRRKTATELDSEHESSGTDGVKANRAHVSDAAGREQPLWSVRTCSAAMRVTDNPDVWSAGDCVRAGPHRRIQRTRTRCGAPTRSTRCAGARWPQGNIMTARAVGGGTPKELLPQERRSVASLRIYKGVADSSGR